MGICRRITIPWRWRACDVRLPLLILAYSWFSAPVGVQLASSRPIFMIIWAVGRKMLWSWRDGTWEGVAKSQEKNFAHAVMESNQSKDFSETLQCNPTAMQLSPLLGNPAEVRGCAAIYPHCNAIMALKTTPIEDGGYSTMPMRIRLVVLAGNGFALRRLCSFGASCIKGQFSTGRRHIADRHPY